MPNHLCATLTGLAVGDALGMPFETLKAQDPKLLSWDGCSYHESSYLGLGPGQWTDDTSMALAITESLLHHHDFCPSDIAHRYVAWYRSPSFCGAGKSTKRALADLDSGCPWVHSGVLGAEGNGPAMRIAPLGLFYHKLPLETITRLASQEASITHDSDPARDGAIAIAVAVALLARREADPGDLMSKVLDHLKEGTVKHRITSCDKAYPKDIPRPWKVLAELGPKFHIVETVPAALFAFATSKNYKTAIETAIRSGGDTDTTAAIAGALAGTYYGMNQVQDFLPGLQDGPRLCELDQRLFDEGPLAF